MKATATIRPATRDVKISAHNDFKLYKIQDKCHEQIRRHGAHAKIIIRMPGQWKNKSTRRYTRNGPHGKIFGHTHDCKKLLVCFPAAELLTSLEELRNGNITG